MEETHVLAKVKPIPVQDDGEFAMYFDEGKFEHIQRISKMFATATVIPDHYRNNPANCLIAIQSSTRLGIAPDAYMQKSYIIHGRPGIESQLVIALINTRGPFKGPVQWKFTGEGKTRSCTAYATHKVTGDVCEETITWAIVEAEGWNKKAGSKWLTIPDKMFKYRSAKWLADLYCPEVILGFNTLDELKDMGPEGGIPLPEAQQAVAPVEARLKQVENVAVETPDVYRSPGTYETSHPIEAHQPETAPEPPKKKRGRPAKPKPESTLKAHHFPVSDPTTESINQAADMLSSGHQQKTDATILGAAYGVIAPEERYSCPGCGHVDPQAATTPDGKLKCLNCLATDVVDRIPE